MSSFTSYKSLFLNLAKNHGYKIHKPSFSDRKNNVDYTLEGQIKTQQTFVKVDLKKKNNKNPNQWVYIEYKNSKGNNGWLYGHADFIVFETGKNFIFVPRKSLINYLNSQQLVRWDLPYVDTAWNAKYRLFRRVKTLEVTTQIQVSDLMNIKGHQIWEKSSK